MLAHGLLGKLMSHRQKLQRLQMLYITIKALHGLELKSQHDMHQFTLLKI